MDIKDVSNDDIAVPWTKRAICHAIDERLEELGLIKPVGMATQGKFHYADLLGQNQRMKELLREITNAWDAYPGTGRGLDVLRPWFVKMCELMSRAKSAARDTANDATPEAR